MRYSGFRTGVASGCWSPVGTCQQRCSTRTYRTDPARCLTKTGWWQLKYFLCSTLLGEIIQFDDHIFQMGWNHQLVFSTWQSRPWEWEHPGTATRSIPKRSQRIARKHVFLFKTSEGVWSLRSKSTGWKLFPGVTRFSAAIFAMVSRWWFQRLWVFFYHKQLEKQIQKNEVCIIFFVHFFCGKKPPNLAFRSYFARIWVFHVFFFPVSEAMFCWSFTISMPLWISRYVCSWPSSRERNKDL